MIVVICANAVSCWTHAQIDDAFGERVDWPRISRGELRSQGRVGAGEGRLPLPSVQGCGCLGHAGRIESSFIS